MIRNVIERALQRLIHGLSRRALEPIGTTSGVRLR